MEQKTKEKGGTKILQDGGLFILKYAETQVLIIRPPTHHDAVLRARNHFEDISNLSPNRIRFKTDKFQDGTSIPDTEISEAAWPAVIKHLTSVEVFIKSQKEVQPLTLTVVSNFYGHKHSYKVKESTTGKILLSAIYGRLGFSSDYRRIRAIYDGRRVSPDDTISSLGMRDEDNIDVYVEKTTGHLSGTFLLSSLPLQVEISLQLSNSWRRPGDPLNIAQPAQDFQWTVNYEGDREPKCPSIDWLAKIDEPNPEAELGLNNDNSVVFPVTSGEGFIDYISSVFRTLGFPEIFYAILEWQIIALFGYHSHIAIRFLSLDELEQHAKLTITPKPNDQIRIIMLYKLLGDEDIIHWQDAIKRRALGPSYWTDRAGVPEAGVRLLDNKDLFRVLDWGMLKVR